MSKQKLVDYNQVEKILNSNKKVISTLIDRNAKSDAKATVLGQQNKKLKTILTNIKQTSDKTKLKEIDNIDNILETIQKKTEEYIKEYTGVEDEEFNQLLTDFGDVNLS